MRDTRYVDIPGLKEAREKAGLSQNALAEILGVTSTCIYNAEKRGSIGESVYKTGHDVRPDLFPEEIKEAEQLPFPELTDGDVVIDLGTALDTYGLSKRQIMLSCGITVYALNKYIKAGRVAQTDYDRLHDIYPDVFPEYVESKAVS